MEEGTLCLWTKELYVEKEACFECWIFKPTCEEGNGVEYDRPREQKEIDFTFCPKCGKRLVCEEI